MIPLDVQKVLSTALLSGVIIWGFIKMKWPAITFNSDAGWMVNGNAQPSRIYLFLQRLAGLGLILAGAAGILLVFFK